MSVLRYREWKFEVDTELTQRTYAAVAGGGADACACNDCQNYVAYREQVFPAEIKTLLFDLGIDYHKESEVCRYDILPNGLHYISGWFHFKGRVLAGPDYREPLPNGGFSINLTKISNNFSLGFAEGNGLAFFKDKTGLVQVEFETAIPWVIDKALESGE